MAYEDLLKQYAVVRHWADKALDSITGSRPLPNAEALLAILPASFKSRSIVFSETEVWKDSNTGQVLEAIRFQTRTGMKNRRLVLPVHFAQIRVLELVPHIVIKLHDDKNRARDKQNGRDRTEDQMIFTLHLHYQKAAADELSIRPRQMELDRVFFNAYPDVRLYERRDVDYRYIVPRHSILLRARYKNPAPHNQKALIEAVLKLMVRHGGQYPFSATQIATLLGDLFTIGDALYWNMLSGRIDEQDRQYHHWSFLTNLGSQAAE
jgi:hypothetical protein